LRAGKMAKFNAPIPLASRLLPGRFLRSSFPSPLAFIPFRLESGLVRPAAAKFMIE
jgi:hypothetical protein